MIRLTAAVLSALAVACTAGPPAGAEGAEGQEIPPEAAEPAVERQPVAAEPEDWGIAESKVRWAREPARDSLPFGELIGALGETFLGTAYEPRTLEVEGPERLVVNLRALDCVTFVENVLALSRLARTAPADVLADSVRFRAAFQKELTALRYREGRLRGYASRLHYFSEWLYDNESKGIVDHLTDQMGGSVDPEPIDFMSTHPEAYRQLADERVLSAIAQIEARLGAVERFVIPAEEIEERAHLIRTGDIIAATSTVPGLDVAHTGIAVWKDGVLRLLHAPLVGSSVELSEVSLAERIASIVGQDGIMVARPIEPEAS
ncbi:MAG: DUF1460 domain-containing protein [Gemmatimonadota bacterium]|nr:DUF1460 domain-containing protein [Gemmatimonadota bacterium]